MQCLIFTYSMNGSGHSPSQGQVIYTKCKIEKRWRKKMSLTVYSGQRVNGLGFNFTIP